MMKHLIDRAAARGAERVDIATSQHSAPFFAKFGAVPVSTTEHGWGPGMHRIDMALSLTGVA